MLKHAMQVLSDSMQLLSNLLLIFLQQRGADAEDAQGEIYS